MANDLLKASEVAELLGVRTVALVTWRRRGEGPRYVVTPGRNKFMYPRADLERWIADMGFSEYVAMRNGDQS